jgi:hypothetical protein
MTGGSVGVTGMTAWASLNMGRDKRLVPLGTSAEYNFPASDGWGAGSQAGFIFGPPTSTLSAMYTALNNLRTAALAHFLIVSGSPVIHLAADTADNTALTAIPVATTPATAIALYSGLVAHLETHVASTTYHTTADAVATAALAALIQVAQSTEDIELNLAALISAYNAHRVLVGAGPVHGSADTTNTCATYTTPTAPTLLAGDTFYTSTVGPQPQDTDLFDGSSNTGALGAIAQSSQQFGMIWLETPVGTSDITTLSAGLDYIYARNKRPILFVRFRDPNAGETDTQYVTAYAAFRTAAAGDNRIQPLAGSWFQNTVLAPNGSLRSFMASAFARFQSFAVIAGQEGEKLAQNPGWVKRGPLEGGSLMDAGGNLVGHDELTRGGIDAANGSPIGGGMSLCYRMEEEVQGTYISNRATVLYGVSQDGGILTPMDRRVASALERTAVGLSLVAIGGADVTDPGPPETLDGDIQTALATDIWSAIVERYPSEFQNARDPGIVTVDAPVTRVGAQLTITGAVKPRFYSYTDDVNLTFSATR